MYYLYILSNDRKNVLYVGITGHLYGRVRQHKEKTVDGFTQQYNVTQLVYYEEYQYVHDAIAREKQLKNWKRAWKEALMRKLNPMWNDLSDGWYN